MKDTRRYAEGTRAAVVARLDQALSEAANDRDLTMLLAGQLREDDLDTFVGRAGCTKAICRSLELTRLTLRLADLDRFLANFEEGDHDSADVE